MRNNQSDQGRRPRRIWKRLLTVLFTLILMGTLAFFILLGVVLAGSHDDIQGEPGVMVILGCQVKPEGPSMLLQDRLNKALDYWKEHPDITIVVSGGQGPDEPVTEARAMADYLIQAGVPEDSLLLAAQSHNTSQNLHYTMDCLREAGTDLSQGVVVVSNGFHLARVRMLAQRAGFEQVSTLAAPSSHWPSRLKMYLREPLALVKSFLLDR